MNAYPHLANLIGAYLNQDYALYADTLDGVIDVFVRDATPEQVLQVRADIAAFRRAHGTDLEPAFGAAFGDDFDPALWGLGAGEFLDRLDRRLAGA